MSTTDIVDFPKKHLRPFLCMASECLIENLQRNRKLTPKYKRKALHREEEEEMLLWKFHTTPVWSLNLKEVTDRMHISFLVFFKLMSVLTSKMYVGVFCLYVWYGKDSKITTKKTKSKETTMKPLLISHINVTYNLTNYLSNLTNK